MDTLCITELMARCNELHILDTPFTKEEIDQTVRDLPNDKVPGPDGFNTNFIKKCWHIIASDFYDLIEDFYHGKINL